MRHQGADRGQRGAIDGGQIGQKTSSAGVPASSVARMVRPQYVPGADSSGRMADRIDAELNCRLPRKENAQQTARREGSG
jgi:hypothetical protein